MKRSIWAVAAVCAVGYLAHGAEQETLHLKISWGYQSPQSAPVFLKLIPTELTVEAQGQDLEPGDGPEQGAWLTTAGRGDVDALEATLRYTPRAVTNLTQLHRIWSDLIARSDPDTARRLRQDPACRPDPRLLTIQMDPEGTRGCSLTVDQLLHHKAFWIPSLDLYLAVGEASPTWPEHQQALAAYKGQRILDQVASEPEASYEQFRARWEDMGSPAYQNPAQTGPGHIVGVTWDSALYKYGIDRGAGVWNDYGNPDRFHTRFSFGDLTPDLVQAWRGQRLTDGLPVLTTDFEKDGVRYRVEQFACPLDGPPAERDGRVPMVLLQKLTITNPTDQPRETTWQLRLSRLLAEAAAIQGGKTEGGFLVQESGANGVLLAAQTGGAPIDLKVLPGSKSAPSDRPGTAWNEAELGFVTALPPRVSREIILKLPSPAVPAAQASKLLALDYTTAREQTLDFWRRYLQRGAEFEVPEPAVNELFRANLWHALRLPRRHGGAGPDVRMDLPYSNFAYDQRGTPWPVNQAVYVDYMLYDLRGYHAIATEELAAIFRNNQEANGHVGGYANWVVYTPGMMYAVARSYLLSGDRARLEALLPQTLRALDWCLGEIERSAAGPAAGLVKGPLNDLTGDGIWAFNQAYLYAGLELLGQALRQAGHPRAQECADAAASFRKSVARAFGRACTRAPLVQLRDHTWVPYVPCEAQTPHRLFTQWYPTDVDTGATHLLRLQALAPDGPLADALLHDHEDNLYLSGWGMANEPVYNQQASAYLARDNPKAAIRAFYSMMACAFSHSTFEPVEHRWSWGQYFGPPSTDGAWFELYRNMLIRESETNTLLLLQAAPRAWWEEGKQIRVERAPTAFGELSLRTRSEGAARRLSVDLAIPHRRTPAALLVRFRQPDARPIRSVTVNGQAWRDFDSAREWIRVATPTESSYTIVAEY